MHIVIEKCTFLWKNAISCRKNAVSCRRCSSLQNFSNIFAFFSGGTWQEISENCRRVSGSRIKSASPLPQDPEPFPVGKQDAGNFELSNTVVAEMVTEFIRFEPEICICNGI